MSLFSTKKTHSTVLRHHSTSSLKETPSVLWGLERCGVERSSAPWEAGETSSRAMRGQNNMFVWRTKITDKYVGYNSLADLHPTCCPHCVCHRHQLRASLLIWPDPRDILQRLFCAFFLIKPDKFV